MKKIKLKVDNIEYGMLVNGLVELRNKLLKEKEDTSPIDELLSCRLELVMKNVIYINSMHLGIATNIVRIYSTFN